VTGPVASARRAGHRRGGPRGLIHRLPPLLWLVLVWIMLWGTWTWANLITGLLVATGIMLALPLPQVVLGTRLHPLGVLAFVVRFSVDLVTSSVQVAWRAVRPGGEPRAAVIGVRLRTRSDLIMTLTAEALSLIPGSLVLEVLRSERTLYVHVFDVRDLDEVERHRRKILDLEARVIRAVGMPAAIRGLEDEEEHR
jgi:multicomponent Na+:H+ antiporter subunit E